MKDIDYSKIDKGCVAIVKYFNDVGLTTWMCCEGHNIPNMSMLWVEFDKSITDSYILHFMNNHSHKWVNDNGEVRSCFIPNGKFCKWAVPSNDGQSIKYTWRYFVGNSKAACQDVETWTRIDKGEILWNGPSFVNLKAHEKAMRRKDNEKSRYLHWKSLFGR